MSTLADYEQQARATDRSEWLGALTYFKVSESNVAHRDLATSLAAAGFNDYVPRQVRDENVFLRVFKEGRHRSGIPTADEAVTECLNIFQVSRGEGKVVKRIVLVTVDAGGDELGFREKTEISFDNAHPDVIGIRDLNGFHAEASVLVQVLTARYHELRGHVDANAVRMVIRAILASTHPTSLRDGLYFVPQDKVDTLDRLEQVGACLPGTIVHSIPLIDDDKQRNNLKAAFESEVTVDADRIVKEINDLLHGPDPVRATRAQSYASQIADSRKKLAEYQTLLEDNLGIAEMRLGVLDAKLGDLLRIAT